MTTPASHLSDRPSRNRIRGARVLGLCLALGLCAGASACVVTETVRPDHGDGRARSLEVAATFDVVASGTIVGQVQQYGDSSSPQKHYFAVMNRWGQELGLVDGLGRIWRHRPHESEPEAVGSGPLAEGVRRLLELADTPQLVAHRAED
ncbi:hypothetical protein Pla163_32680 [Planctomycetes bacterium Pla163]|uniref:Uncharacterized protein n=1 Tax=Rohdeia mirabilis TaxID=2528008 RepID=A0A518D3U5_9BACT|nr:hypothetical protein Pla163_32680 [Planctomycetes bacterium Pla163]